MDFINYNGSWEGFFRWSALYGVFDSFVCYPYGSVYLFLSLTFSTFISTLIISLFFLSFYFCFKLLYESLSFLPLNCNKDKDKDTNFNLLLNKKRKKA